MHKALPKTKTIGAYEAKTHLPALLKEVAAGREIIITKRNQPIARLAPLEQPVSSKQVFEEIRSLRGIIKLAPKETPGDLIKAGRRL
jgi:prevent-host-death family protein